MEQKYEVIKHSLQTLLKSNIVEVHFTKKDGDFRVMRCTLDPTHLPLEPLENQLQREHKYTPNEEVLPVWDLEKKGWRSFRIDSVHEYLVVRE